MYSKNDEKLEIFTEEEKRPPILDAGAGLHGLELGGDAADAPICHLVEVHQRRVPDQLRITKDSNFTGHAQTPTKSAKTKCAEIKRTWAGAHLGDILGDRRRGLSHWATKLKNPREEKKDKSFILNRQHNRFLRQLARTAKRKPYGFGAEILGAGRGFLELAALVGVGSRWR
jgi:hypothetical protein